MVRILLLIPAAVVMCSCGRYGPPRPPEHLAPQEVTDIEVKPQADKVSIKWKSPEKDVRDKELKTLDGYIVERANRKEMREGVPLDEFMAELAVIADRNIEDRDTLRREARERGEISRRVKVPEEKRVFSYDDTTARTEETYIYRIVPINQGDVRGTPSKLIEVLFKGEQSDVSIFKDENALEQEMLQTEFEQEEGTLAKPDLLPFGK